MTVYKNFALLYDSLMEDAPYDEWIQLTNDLILDRKVEQIVDLGCGTGEITVALAKEQDRRVFGVDLSADMLAIAEQKSLQAQTEVTWIKQDIRNLQGFQDVDLFISYCDVINYIVEEADLLQLFTNVYDSLAMDGLFIFDVHSMNHVTETLRDETFAYTDDSLAYIWHCIAGEDAGEMYHEMTFFYEDKEEGFYRRIEESHHQRTYHVETYVNLLAEAQFNHVNIFADFLMENEFSEQNSERIFIIAKK